MKNKKQIVISGMTLFLITITLLGLTYAYYKTKVIGNNNEKTISSVGKKLEVTYTDGNGVIEASGIEPGYTVTKTFSVKNIEDGTATYSIKLDNMTSTFSRTEDWTYVLKKGDAEVSSGVLPTADSYILDTISIDSKTTDSYSLTITYANPSDVDQSVDMGKSLSLRVNIDDFTNPYKNDTGTLVNAILNNAILGTGTTKMGSEVTEFTKVSGANDRLLNIAPDDYGTSYYYYGAVIDNYVTFANKLWRIVRINGDGTVRLVLDDVAKDSSGSVIKTAYNLTNNDNTYVGYMYGVAGSTAYDDTHKNINDSTIKTKADAWYKTNIVDTNNSDYVADTLFCNDKTLAANGIGGVTNQLGYGTNVTFYGSTGRLLYGTGTTSIATSKPTFKCAENATNDYSRFTVNVSTLPSGNKTNGNLTYPVGLLTSDEVAYAGAYKSFQTNKTYYLYNSSISSNWWLFSPYNYNGSNVSEWFVGYSSGYLGSYKVSDSSFAFRPSINLKSSVLKSAGDGTKENPYVIE